LFGHLLDNLDTQDKLVHRTLAAINPRLLRQATAFSKRLDKLNKGSNFLARRLGLVVCAKG
jgi:hypothetical protein